MICKPGERYDHLTVIRESHRIEGQTRVICKCDCGVQVERSDYVLRRPTVKYKACNSEGCEFSFKRNEKQDMSYFEKKNRRNYKTKEARGNQSARAVGIDPKLSNMILGMAWR